MFHDLRNHAEDSPKVWLVGNQSFSSTVIVEELDPDGWSGQLEYVYHHPSVAGSHFGLKYVGSSSDLVQLLVCRDVRQAPHYHRTFKEKGQDTCAPTLV